MQSLFNYTIKTLTCFGVESDETRDELAPSIKNECLRNCVAVGKQKAYEIFVRLSERVLNPKLFCEGRHPLFVAWSTDIQSNDTQPLSLVFFQ